MEKTKVKVFIINGKMGAGKDTFVNYCISYLHHRGYAISTVDFIKEIARSAGWNGEKTPEARNYLSDLKDLFTNWLDTPFKEVEKKIKEIEFEAYQYNLDASDFYLFVHCREPKEIDRMVKEFGAKTIFIQRPDAKIEAFNHADMEVENYKYDFIINNDGTIQDLMDKANIFINAFRTSVNCPYCGHHINPKEEHKGYCPICDKLIPNLKF